MSLANRKLFKYLFAINSMKKSVIYRTKEGDCLKDEIFSLLLGSGSFLSTQDISTELNKPWHSIQTRCLMLQIENKVNGLRIGRMNLWQANKEDKKNDGP